jgi:hypothetical protein
VSRSPELRTIVVAVLGVVGAARCAQSGPSRAPEVPYTVATVTLGQVAAPAPIAREDAATPVSTLPERLGEPPPLDPRTRSVYSSGGFDADAGDFRPPSPYALLVVHDENGYVESRIPLSASARACVVGRPALLRLRIARGRDGGPDVGIEEQEGLDASAVGCVVGALRKDRAHWPSFADAPPMGLDVIVR